MDAFHVSKLLKLAGCAKYLRGNEQRELFKEINEKNKILI